MDAPFSGSRKDSTGLIFGFPSAGDYETGSREVLINTALVVPAKAGITD